MIKITFFLVLLISPLIFCIQQITKPQREELIDDVLSNYLHIKTREDASTFLDILEMQIEVLEREGKSNPKLKSENSVFTCPSYPRSSPKPTSVHKLRPGDIDVVMALGDSLTAAFGAGAGSIFTVFTEYRGMSWCIGGDSNLDSILTVPNVLKLYNPNVKGFSIKTGTTSSSNSKT